MDKKGVIIILIFICVFPIVNAEIVSIDSGGGMEIILDSGGAEEFFSCVPYTCADLGYSCGTWDNGCGGTLNCGTCASGYTCSVGTCVAEEEAPGADGGLVPSINIVLYPAEISLRMVINMAVDQEIKVTNLGISQVTVSVSQSGLENMVILNTTSLTLAVGETQVVNARFVAPSQPGIYTGRIIIGNKQALVILDVKTKFLLFDSNIVVLNEDYKVPRGENLKTQVTLIPLGDKERLDVTLNYVIKDYEGNVYLTQSETVLVEEQINFKREFSTGMLPLGRHIVGLELVYPGGIAPSSAHFEITGLLTKRFLAKIIFYLIIAIVIIGILVLLILIVKYAKKRY